MSAPSRTSSSPDIATPLPPTARREEDRVVLAGRLPDDHPLKSKLIRQAESSTNALLDPPRKIPDPYGWLRDDDRTNEEVLEHLKKENAYTEAMTSHLSSFRDKLYQELVSCIQETDYTTPANKEGKYWYYTRTNQGESYTLYCRAPYNGDEDMVVDWDGTQEAPILPGETVYLNVNELAKDKAYCSVSSVSVSKSQKLLAYGADYTGDEIYSLYVKNLETGDIVDHDESIECSGRVVWGLDENTVFYVKMDEAHRPYQVYRRKLDGSKGDELLFQQDDDLFWTSIHRSSDDKYLLIDSSSSETTQVHYLDLTDANAKLERVAKRRQKVLYDVDHWNGHWIITSNVDGTPNMRLMVCKVGQDESHWKDMTLIENDETEVKLFDGGYEYALSNVETFEKYLVASGRYQGIPRIWVLELEDNDKEQLTVKKSTLLTFEEDAYDLNVGMNYNFDSDKLVVMYDSLTTPLQSMEITMNDPNNQEARRVLKAKHVPGYDKADFDCQRTFVTSRDGKTEIPVSIVYRRDAMEQHESTGKPLPVHLNGYGSYGASSEADFSVTRLPLLNRGMVCVVAHVRGGGEMGRQWYEEPNGAKYLCKENTFNDFVDVAKWLLDDKKLTTPSQLSIEGRSAGGLLIGASINQAPEMFGVAILGVPFVDVVATMTDSSIPLTCGEW
jgi:Protease II